jgi:ribonucleoside-diphosphate reductase alpha chain
MQTGSESVTPTGSTAAATPVATNPNPTRMAATAPGQLRVIKRNGTVVPFEDSKISVAITKAFLAVEGGTAAASSRIHETVAKLTEQVIATFQRRMPSGGTIHIEDIQDQVELALMRAGEHKIARDYVIYRESRAQERAAKAAALSPETAAAANAINVVQADGSRAPLDIERIRTIVAEACVGLTDVSESEIIDEALRNLYDGVSAEEVSTALVITARTLIEQEPNYSYAAARLLLDNLRAEGLAFMGIAESATQADMHSLYAVALQSFISRGIELELLAPELAEFDLERLGKAILPERDLQFTYLGLQTLYDRYFIHSNEVRFELPQIFFMRVAMGLAINEDRPRGARHRVLRAAVILRLHELDADPVQFRHAAPAAVLLLPDHGAGRPRSASTAPSRTTPCCPSSPAAWATTGRPCAAGLLHQGHQRQEPGRRSLPQGRQRHRRRRQPGRQAQGGRLRLPRDLAHGHRGVPRAAQEHRRRPPPHARHEHRQLDSGPVHEAGVRGRDWTLFSPNDVPDLHDLYGKAFEQRYDAVRGDGRARRNQAAQDRQGARPLAQDARRCSSRPATPG